MKSVPETVKVTVKDDVFFAPVYRMLSCSAEFIDCSAIPGDGPVRKQTSWEDAQSGFATWCNWDSKEANGRCIYTPLPSGVAPKCYTRPVPGNK